MTEQPRLRRADEQATWGRTACHWLPPAERAALIRSMICSQALSGITITDTQGEAALLRVLHEPLAEIG